MSEAEQQEGQAWPSLGGSQRQGALAAASPQTGPKVLTWRTEAAQKGSDRKLPLLRHIVTLGAWSLRAQSSLGTAEFHPRQEHKARIPELSVLPPELK